MAHQTITISIATRPITESVTSALPTDGRRQQEEGQPQVRARRQRGDQSQGGADGDHGAQDSLTPRPGMRLGPAAGSATRSATRSLPTTGARSSSSRPRRLGASGKPMQQQDERAGTLPRHDRATGTGRLRPQAVSVGEPHPPRPPGSACVAPLGSGGRDGRQRVDHHDREAEPDQFGRGGDDGLVEHRRQHGSDGPLRWPGTGAGRPSSRGAHQAEAGPAWSKASRWRTPRRTRPPRSLRRRCAATPGRRCG